MQMLLAVSKILKIESKSQRAGGIEIRHEGC